MYRKLLKSLCALSLLGGCAGAVGDGPWSDEVSESEAYGSVEQAMAADCSNPVLAPGCRAIEARINSELRAANLTLGSGDTVLSFFDGQSREVLGGCTVSAKVSRTKATATLAGGASLPLANTRLQDALAVRVSVPANVRVVADAKARFGLRVFFGSCSNVGSDTFSIIGTARPAVDVIVALALNPSVSRNASGATVVTLKPRVGVAPQLGALSLSASLSGEDVAVRQFRGKIFQEFRDQAEPVLNERPAAAFFAAAKASWPLGRPIQASTQSESVRQGILGLLAGAVRPPSGVRVPLQQQLTRQIRSALKVDSAGERVFFVEPSPQGGVVVSDPECRAGKPTCSGNRVRSCENGSFQFQSCPRGCKLVYGFASCQ